MAQEIRFKLNGRSVSLVTDGERPLLWVLRADIGLTGVKYGCGQGHCGSCTVVINREAVRACRYPVKDAAGKEVLTIEGLAVNGKLHPLQKAFMRHGAVQCGFCTPGMILQAYSLLVKNADPSRAEIVSDMERNLCRCGAYSRIVDAIQAAAAELRGGRA